MGRSYTSKGSAEPFEFDIDGVAFACAGGVSLLDMCEMAKLAEADADSMEGAAAIAELFRGALGKADYDRFRAHTREHHTDTDTIIEILRDLVEHVTGGPSKRSRQSVPGPQVTNGMSPDASRLGGRELTEEEIARFRAVIDGQASAPAMG